MGTPRHVQRAEFINRDHPAEQVFCRSHFYFDRLNFIKIADVTCWLSPVRMQLYVPVTIDEFGPLYVVSWHGLGTPETCICLGLRLVASTNKANVFTAFVVRTRAASSEASLRDTKVH